MLHVLVGEDDFSVKQALDEIKKGIGDPANLAANTTLLDGQQVTVEQLRHACGTVPFLAEKRLVIVEGLLGRFEPKPKQARKKSENPAARQEECKLIADCARHVPDFVELVLVDGKLSSRNPLLSELAAGVRVKSFPLLKGAALGQWVQRRINGAGATISPAALDLLLRFVGGNLWVMANEVDKLSQFVGGNRIEEGDIRVVVSYAQEANVFQMVDAILEFKAGAAQDMLQQLLKDGAAPTYLLVMLARQVQLLCRVKELKGQGKSRNEIQNKMGLTSDFVLRKALGQADKYSGDRLREVYHKLLETDMSIKTGKYDGELALNILVAELGQRGAVAGLKK